ncbi:MAG: hypothetical protein R2789_03930 [Microthrixaceae bacterium]
MALILGAFALVAGACGSDDATASSGDTQSTDAQASLDGTDSEGSVDSADGEAEGTSEGVEMIDVATGEKVDLEEALTPDGKPLLAWFWAPFCPTCRGEALSSTATSRRTPIASTSWVSERATTSSTPRTSSPTPE